ncbi:hypothetical protein WH47_02021 [Habropoda laboriosa]|uniref:Uncharacterized protein n=1 Tax=Habropoda laboriosa TaxID=597456 RepID=A0A0L7R305_9HYME|nr:hypothetical protein WH47_02021 [Habropoda laboriosa]
MYDQMKKRMRIYKRCTTSRNAWVSYFYIQGVTEIGEQTLVSHSTLPKDEKKGINIGLETLLVRNINTCYLRQGKNA